MKHLLLSLTLILSANAWADNISFYLNCKTSELVTTETKDGKSNTEILAEETPFTIDWYQEIYNDKYFNQVSLSVPGESGMRFYFNENQLISNLDGTFIFDVDGVLTDGKVYFLENEIMRALNSKDGYALQYACKMGYQIFIITGGYSEDLKRRLLELGIKEVHLRSSNKLKVYQELKSKYNISDKQVLYMGDDIPDIPVLKEVGVSSCPQDAAIDVKANVDYQSPYDGGKACVRDVIEQTLRLHNKWFDKDSFKW